MMACIDINKAMPVTTNICSTLFMTDRDGSLACLIQNVKDSATLKCEKSWKFSGRPRLFSKPTF